MSPLPPRPLGRTAMTDKTVLPADPKERKALPVASGVLDYFPAAFIEIAKVSKAGNDQHNPGQPLHWARGKSNDHADAMQRHFIERGTVDSDGLRHSAKMAWRALAILQEELEATGAPLARGAIVAQSEPMATITSTGVEAIYGIIDGDARSEEHTS